MAWTQRLGGAAAEEGRAEPAANGEPEAPAGIDSGRVDRAAIVEILRNDLVEISEGKLALAEVDPNGHLFDYGYVDSLSAVVFLARIESRFGIEIEDIELIEELTTVDLIAGRLAVG